MGRTIILIIALILGSNLAMAATTATTATAATKKAYITDDLSVPMRSGPTNAYKLTAWPKAGESVEILAIDPDNQRTQIKLDNGRIGWVRTRSLSQLPSAQSRLSVLKRRQAALKSKLGKTTAKSQDLKGRINQISRRNIQLQRQMTTMENQLQIAQQKALRLSDTKRFDMFYKGGVVAGVGVILGFLIGRRRKRTSEW